MGKILKDLKNYAIAFAKDNNVNHIGDGYFYDFRHNIFGKEMKREFEKMFLDGDGNELTSKACAPHSSSMMGYNFFHWINKDNTLTIQFKDEKVTYNEVLFEVKIPVLIGSRCANMDIVLKNNEGDWLFIESKFLEYLKCEKFQISDTYKCKNENKEEKYYCKGDEWRKFISQYDTSKNTQYWQGIKQEICHLIGLTNWMERKTQISKSGFQNGEEEFHDRNITFINLVFEPNKDYIDEWKHFNEYQCRYAELHESLKNTKLIPDGLKMEFMTYSQLWENYKQSTLPDGLEKYLYEHYMQFSSAC